MSWPADGGRAIAIPAGRAKVIGVWFAAGVPTITVTDRTVSPARNVNTAVPSVPVTISSVVTLSPALIAAAVAVATAGLLLVTETGVAVPAGTDKMVTATLTWRPAAVNTCPADGGSAIASPTSSANAVTVCPTMGSLTDTIATAVPRADVAMIVTLPTAAPTREGGSLGHVAHAAIDTSSAVSPAASTRFPLPGTTTDALLAVTLMGRSSASGAGSDKRSVPVCPRGRPDTVGVTRSTGSTS